MKMSMLLFWDTTALKMETICFLETLVSTYKSTRRHNPEEQHWLHVLRMKTLHCLIIIRLLSYSSLMIDTIKQKPLPRKLNMLMY
jgi:hypothetical protein